MKVTTWNVNGIRARESQVADWLRLERPDVLCLQEIKASPEQVPANLLEHAGYWSCWHGEGGYSGVALLVSKALCPVRPRFVHPAFDLERRAVVVELGSFRLASLYIPNGGKDFPTKERFLDGLERWVASEHALGHSLLLCGDFNVAHTAKDVHPKLANPQEIGQTPGERTRIDVLLGRGLVDLGRKFAPEDDSLFTWWAPWRQSREKNIGWRLDWVLASEPLVSRALRCTALRDFGTSDHGPVTAVFDGPLFNALEVVEAPAEAPKPAPTAPKAPQLDLFGG